ncbi:asparagine synthase (glutamine-hydrolyzing) [Thermoanaerobacterium thermosaccharolyticum DSM 571]|uniref:asparagine synthase (glutamine-hydrolyzing) n=1 Tax=Thermoanaerobacterium thermosaccharolyticum (strain ATCC 7956 / DSM 571 / NCIMB 9385 / NCA 3814 / NCTC 13789 / WDCM 00135 / 2032) TaxID=580327 RepID=D9TR59_THETC|nr:asparagine synthase (glutamine-hydrolyzing) [Thermoanaerobacterium thermosaccharolyticum]ADL69311.1 asparagine synthase (glutamine-hydrolyzing) [Thermoanaerobacterium thermosaccharolyticum DSM 571]
MCGIAGWVSFEEDLTHRSSIIASMGEKLKNRGPDSWGIWLSPHCAFAQTRLIVIDPEGGVQPMIKEYGDKKYVIIYNGELYNTEEIRHELALLGYTFKGHSDTEVLLTSYIEWGTECVYKLNGIYAFAVWDEHENRLFLSRDRLGVKPLFYTYKNGSLIFGSEIKAILAHPYVQAEVDEEGLAEIFVMGPTRTPGVGVFRNIYELKPGHFLTFSKSGVKIEKYWSLISREHEDDLDTTMEKIRFLLDDASKRQLVSDVPLCSLLSGGLDSTAVSVFANEKLKRLGSKLKTYSVDYIGNDKYFKPNQFQPNSDSDLVEIVSKEINTNHNYVYVDNEELADALIPALYARDLPGMADVDSSLYLFLREVKKDVKVALSGEGADEVFGGYPWFRNKSAIEANTFPWIRMVEERMKLLSPQVVKLIRPLEYLNDRYREALNEVPKLPGEDKESARMREIFYLNQTRFLAMLLDRMDRMSMASGLEVRVPFLDHRLVEYVWNIPWEMKNLHNREKGLLRESLKGYIPSVVVERKKSPYPKTHNPVFRRKVKGWLQEIIDNPTSPILQLINRTEVQNLIDTDARDYDPAWFSQLMGGPQLFAYLIQINEWLLKYNIKIV